MNSRVVKDFILIVFHFLKRSQKVWKLKAALIVPNVADFNI